MIDRLNSALEGRYRIERELGEGGMATVFLADDLRHDRKVALKVLKPELAAVVGAERFLAEIKTTANLQHPHILPLFDSGEAGSFLFYVMPYVEGESLRDKLNREKQLPVEEAVDIARKVADALDYAHEHDVVHRDVKPANILLSERGEPLVADFGIALALSAAGGDRITETGLSLGTPHYMSPEQAAGDHDASPRSDVYALGCVLYEMLVGEPPFAASTAQGVLARLLVEEPRRVTDIRRAVPAHVEAVVARSLEKLPADRFGSAAGFGRAVGDPTFRHGGAKGQEDGRRWVWAAALSSLAAVLSLGGLVWALAGRGSGPEPVMRLSITLPESAPISFVPGAAGNVRPAMALSADGETMVYVSRDAAGITRLYQRRLDSFDPEPIEGTDGASAPFFSPDGAWVAFFTGAELRKVSLSDGQVVTLGPAVDAYGGTWADHGRIYYSNGQANRVLSVRASGDAEPEDTGLEDLHWPDAVPGGSVLIASGTGTDAIYAVDLETSRRVRVAEGGLGRFVPPGTVIFLRGNELWAIPFDPDGLRVTGEAFQVLAGVRHEAGYRGGGHLAAARNGVLAYVAGPYLSETRFSWVYREGPMDTLDFPAADHGQFEISPDDSEVAVCIADDVWVYDLERGIRRRLTNDGSSCMPAWSADGRSVLFRRQGSPDDHPPAGIYQQRVGGTGEMELIWRAGPDTAFIGGYAWIDNDTRLLTGVQAGGRVDLVAYDTASAAVEVLVDRSRRDYWPVLSPDGRLIAYSSVESGEELVYVEPYPPTGDRVQISAEGGAEEPRWTRDGSQVVYRRGRQLLTAAITAAPRLRADRPQVIHEGDFVNVGGWSWDMTDNAGRLLLLHSRAGESSTRTVNFVFGFSELLHHRSNRP